MRNKKMKNLIESLDWDWSEETEEYWDLYAHWFIKYLMVDYWWYRFKKLFTRSFPMKTEKEFEKHRKNAYICCPETCWCWDYETSHKESKRGLPHD